MVWMKKVGQSARNVAATRVPTHSRSAFTDYIMINGKINYANMPHLCMARVIPTTL
jgi:hypothetical protein